MMAGKRRLKSKKLLHRAWSQLSKSMRDARGCCEICGSSEHLCVHHILEKRVWPCFWLERRDLIVLCRRCHFKVHNHQAAEFICWLSKHKPEQWRWIQQQLGCSSKEEERTDSMDKMESEEISRLEHALERSPNLTETQKTAIRHLLDKIREVLVQV